MVIIVNQPRQIGLVFAAVILCIAIGSARATDFEHDNRPILAAHGYSCHGPEKRRGGLRLDRKADAFRGGDTGPSVVRKKSDDSLLYRKVTSTDPDERMPQRGDPLTADQIKNIKTWIDQGADWPEEAKGAEHWAFQPVKRSAMTDVHRHVIKELLACYTAESVESEAGELT